MAARIASPASDPTPAPVSAARSGNDTPTPDGARPAAIDGGLQALAGWGRYPVERCRLYQPAGFEQAAALFASADERTIVPRGLGRSYGDAALNGGARVVSALRLNHILAFDAPAGAVECEAGASLDEIIRLALPYGFFLAVTPGTRYVTVGGAIAADVHGKNHHVAGSFSKSVLEFDLLAGNGELIRCSRELRADVFWATVGGMGLTGMITRARIRLRPVESAFLVVRCEKAGSLGEALERLEAGDRASEYSVAWVDCAARGPRCGRSLVMLGRHAAAGELSIRPGAPLALKEPFRLNVAVTPPVSPLFPWAVRGFNSLYWKSKPAISERLVDLYRYFYPLDAVANWNRLYGPRGFVQYQVAVPHAAARAVFSNILGRVTASGRAAFLGVLKRFGEASAGMLSFPFPGATLALDLAVDRELPTLLGELDAMVADHGGRVYLAKDATLTPHAFARSYPRLDEFRQVQRRLDPRRRMSSSLARRLKIVDG